MIDKNQFRDVDLKVMTQMKDCSLLKNGSIAW